MRVFPFCKSDADLWEGRRPSSGTAPLNRQRPLPLMRRLGAGLSQNRHEKQELEIGFKYGYGTTSFFLFLALATVEPGRNTTKQKREMLLTQLDGNVRGLRKAALPTSLQDHDSTSHTTPTGPPPNSLPSARRTAQRQRPPHHHRPHPTSPGTDLPGRARQGPIARPQRRRGLGARKAFCKTSRRPQSHS